ncbi:MULTISPECIES: anti-sigma factor domain-containing protein [Streptomyces]|uniref:Anti-sigma factor n=1 Tax=Streptomyces fungicidicus TaxID=68203 RepID=A0ACC7Y0L1_9ACTN|nr:MULTISPECIES: anti-sigma factor [Streptomyces]NUV75489.1 anti-sigma factor [Streptomyces fungicidicus]PAX83562.1 anti-sigma factor [Streptomyces albidoflavus]PAX92509.1 anti-sigma factor [Streptomyces albidoflavus]PBO19552.1 anti-sigma factor [Streptomyces albidoflavus]PBO22012.1 anti-sigma factor [Streptomyces albidoflavus]
MTTAELHTLTGAYALHALSEEERDAFDRHLADCPACTTEVAELTATAARLGLAEAAVPPPAMKDEVLRRIGEVRQEPPRTAAATATPRAGRARRFTGFALAACLAAVAGLGGVAVWQHQEAEQARQRAEAAERQAASVARVLAAPDARSESARLGEGTRATVVVSASLDEAVLLAADMPAPPEGKVYQLWFDDGGTMRSAGLMPPSRGDGVEAVRLEGGVGEASGVGITVEPPGGSEQPTSEPVGLLSLPA